MQRTQLLRERRILFTVASDEELLVSAVHEMRDLITDQHAGLANSGKTFPAVVEHRRGTVLRDARAPGTLRRNGKSRLAEAIQPVTEAECTRFLSAKEHRPIIGIRI